MNFPFSFRFLLFHGQNSHGEGVSQVGMQPPESGKVAEPGPSQNDCLCQRLLVAYEGSAAAVSSAPSRNSSSGVTSVIGRCSASQSISGFEFCSSTRRFEMME